MHISDYFHVMKTIKWGQLEWDGRDKVPCWQAASENLSEMTSELIPE